MILIIFLTPKQTLKKMLILVNSSSPIYSIFNGLPNYFYSGQFLLQKAAFSAFGFSYAYGD